MIKTIFVYGDSISLGYGPYLKEMISSRFELNREKEIATSTAEPNKYTYVNGETSTRAVQFMEKKQANNEKTDILLINCGLHDIVRHISTDQNKVSLPQYFKNIEYLIKLTKQIAQKVIWVRTTPVNDIQYNTAEREIRRYNEDVIKYNEAADGIMAANSVDIADLYTFTASLEDQFSDGVHFIPKAQQLQAAFIAGALFSIIK